MNKISNAFKNGKALIGFITAGDPNLDKTVDFIKTMEKAGADLIELGIPFSDPAADGPVIEKASIRALQSGTTPEKIFNMLSSIKDEISIPIVFLTYLNPVFNYGYEKFFEKCSKCGVSGIIIPDLPYEEQDEVIEWSKKYNIALISFIAQTSKNRIKMIAEKSEGFIYCVSSLGVTGVKKELSGELSNIVSHIREATNTPIAIGFGISTEEQAKYISEFADGVIIGSAIVDIIDKYGENADQHLHNYISSIKKAIS